MLPREMVGETVEIMEKVIEQGASDQHHGQ
jgi:hypothetical protein